MKIVIFTQRVEIIDSYNERRDCADQRIAQFIKSTGYLPIPIPNDKYLAKDIVDELNPSGIVLSGGNSLMSCGGNAPERDGMDRELISISEKRMIPLYGFCRGMQSILYYYGAKLENINNHVAIKHRVYGSIEGNVNSFHNQACRVENLPNELTLLAQTEDGVVEAVKHKRLPIFGTMWHPEREDPFNNLDCMRLKQIIENKNIIEEV